jgi:hypothetical protein
MAVELHELPIGVTLGEANRHDIKLPEATLRQIVTAHPEGANVCLDAEYADAQKVVEGMGYEAYIRPRGKKQEKKKNPRFKARRWVVEGPVPGGGAWGGCRGACPQWGLVPGAVSGVGVGVPVPWGRCLVWVSGCLSPGGGAWCGCRGLSGGGQTSPVAVA